MKALCRLFADVLASFGAVHSLFDHVARDAPVDCLANGQRWRDDRHSVGLVAVLVGDTDMVNNVEVTVASTRTVFGGNREMDFSRIHIGEVPQQQCRFACDESAAFGPEHRFHQLGMLVEWDGHDPIDTLRSSFEHARSRQTTYLLIANTDRRGLLNGKQPVLRHGDFH